MARGLTEHSGRRRPPRPPPGSSPDALHVDPAAPHSTIHVVTFGPVELAEHDPSDPASLGELRGAHPVLWVDVVGLGDGDGLRGVAEAFGLHPLAMADVVHVDQRPKVEAYGDQLFIVLRMTNPVARDTEQLSLFLGRDFVLTFQERAGDCFDPVRERLRRGGNRIRRSGADYLAYALIDAVVDAYRPALHALQDDLEALEVRLLAERTSDPIPALHGVRRRLQTMRHEVLPAREVLAVIARDDADLISDETALFLRDCQDHVMGLQDGIESARDLVNSLVDMSVSLVGQRMNDVMKVLTIIATIFIPLSFVAGVFGMNFDPEVSPWNMPELRQPWGYPAALLLMAAIALLMVAWFRRLGWIGTAAAARPDDADDAR